MNLHQKIGFGVLAVLVLAWAAIQVDALTILIVGAAIVAVLTLTTTWKILFWIIEWTSRIIATLLHGVGFGADWVAVTSKTRRARIDAAPSAKSSGVEEIDEPSEELDVPRFMKASEDSTKAEVVPFLTSAFDRQNPDDQR